MAGINSSLEAPGTSPSLKTCLYLFRAVNCIDTESTSFQQLAPEQSSPDFPLAGTISTWDLRLHCAMGSVDKNSESHAFKWQEASEVSKHTVNLEKSTPGRLLEDALCGT